MKLILDARSLHLYPVGKPGFTGGTEQYVRHIANGLAGRGHEVHLVTPDLDAAEQKGPAYWWWPAGNHPDSADAVVMFHSMRHVMDYAANHLIFATNGVDPDLGPEHAHASAVDAFPLFSQKHGELLRQFRPTVREEQCFITGLGVEIDDYWQPAPEDPTQLPKTWGELKVPGRLFWANDPARGLWHMLDIYDQLRKLRPDVTLHVGYDFNRQFEHHRWTASHLSEVLWECKARLEATEGVTNVGALAREELIREQLECHVHVMASDPPNVGSQIHGMLQMELAAAGSPLVLSDTEAFAEVFGDAAIILPIPGTFLKRAERRCDAQDWAERVAEVMEDPERWAALSRASRALAERHSWANVIERWEGMLNALESGEAAGAEEPEDSPVGVA